MTRPDYRAIARAAFDVLGVVLMILAFALAWLIFNPA